MNQKNMFGNLKFFLLVLCSCFVVGNSHAQVGALPPVEGYLSGWLLFPNADDFGQYYCGELKHWSGQSLPFDHIEFHTDLPPNLIAPIRVYCRTIAENGSPSSPFLVLDKKNKLKFCLDGSPVDENGKCPLPEEPPTCKLDNPSPHVKSGNYGNPINFFVGDKKQREHDYAGSFGLEFTRYYSSKNLATLPLLSSKVRGWRHNYTKQLFAQMALINTSSTFLVKKYEYNIANSGQWTPKTQQFMPGTSQAQIIGPNGYPKNFQSSDDGNTWQGKSGEVDKLSVGQRDANGRILEWRLVTSSNDVETYNYAGQLVTIRFQNGIVQTLSYDNEGRLSTVTDTFGRSLRFEYDADGRMTKMIDPSNQSFLYFYDTYGNLTSVTYPDGLKRIYLYGEMQNMVVSDISIYRNLMTGIEEERTPGVLTRLATFKYQEIAGNGALPISTEYAGGVAKYSYDYTGKVVTHPSGQKEFLNFTKINGAKLCAGSSQIINNISVDTAYVHDVNGNQIGGTDLNGVKVIKSYDLLQNLEASRTDAADTAQAQTTSIIYHSIHRIPTQIFEPLLRTTYEYDANGNVLTKSIQATTDSNGSQGAAANPVGSTRTWTYTYNNFGQVLTATGPRTDVLDRVSYTYDAQGNLTTVTNATGHVTTMSNYDPHGHVGLITDPNGVTTALIYHPRGWLLSRAVTADGITETTNYTYDGVGQMTQVTLPDASVISYTYDDAHRLTKINDHLGNSINYTLDNAGNRIKEETKDASGTLSGQVTRVYDTLNRLKEVTGGAQ